MALFRRYRPTLPINTDESIKECFHRVLEELDRQALVKKEKAERKQQERIAAAEARARRRSKPVPPPADDGPDGVPFRRPPEVYARWAEERARRDQIEKEKAERRQADLIAAAAHAFAGSKEPLTSKLITFFTERGGPLPENAAAAVKLFRKAAKSGDETAILMLAEFEERRRQSEETERQRQEAEFRRSKPPPQFFRKELEEFARRERIEKEAAERRQADLIAAAARAFASSKEPLTSKLIAFFTERGEPLPKNDAAAIKLFRKAAKSGDETAILMLAEIDERHREQARVESERKRQAEAEQRRQREETERQRQETEARRRREEAERQERARQQQDGKRKKGQQPKRGAMSAEQALTLLGLSAGATEKDIRKAWVQRMRTGHPDAGGTNELAKQLNIARDILLKR